MSDRTAQDTNWQQLAHEFKPGDSVSLLGDGVPQGVARVVAVWPAIGMIDVQYGTSSTRLPVEDVIKLDGNNPYEPPQPQHALVPGGVGTVPVSGGPPDKMVKRVAAAHLKRALYWAARDRQYRPSKMERETGRYSCPKCGEAMRKMRYKRRNGCTEKLLGCSECLFLIKPMDAGLEA